MTPAYLEIAWHLLLHIIQILLQLISHWHDEVRRHIQLVSMFTFIFTAGRRRLVVG